MKNNLAAKIRGAQCGCDLEYLHIAQLPNSSFLVLETLGAPCSPNRGSFRGSCCHCNAGSNSTREAVHATQQGFSVGMDAALHINPYYGKTSETGVLRHFKTVLEEGPAMIYNVPGTIQSTGTNMLHHDLTELHTIYDGL